MKLRLERRPLAFSSLLLLGLCGCYQVLGLGDYKSGAGGSGGSSSNDGGSASTSSMATGSTSTGGGNCAPSSKASCYSGPTGTEGNGICKAGQKTCKADGMGYLACAGEILPASETCTNAIDDDCDGNECAEWSHVYGDATDQTVSGVAVDSQGNLLMAGTFTGSLAFDPANPISANGTQVYLAKFDKLGALVWNKVFPSTGATTVAGIAVDTSDNVFIAGVFDTTIALGGSPLVIGTLDTYAGFIAKFSPTGAHVFSSPLEFDNSISVSALATDSGGNVVVVGYQNRDSDDLGRAWVEKRTPGGSVSWHKTSAGATHSGLYPTGVALDPFDNVLIAGGFFDTDTLNGASFISAGGGDAFIAKLTPLGALASKNVFGDAGNQTATGIASDSAGNIFVTGTYAGKISLGTTSVTSAGGDDIFVARIDGTNTGWLKSFGDPAKQTGGSISVSHSGAPVVIFTGSTQGNVDYGDGVLTGAGGLDIPLVKLDATGGHVWSRLFGDAADQAGTGIALLNNGESVMTANVKGGLTVGAGPLTSKGGFDVLLARFAP